MFLDVWVDYKLSGNNHLVAAIKVFRLELSVWRVLNQLKIERSIPRLFGLMHSNRIISRWRGLGTGLPTILRWAFNISFIASNHRVNEVLAHISPMTTEALQWSDLHSISFQLTIFTTTTTTTKTHLFRLIHKYVKNFCP